MDMAHLAMDRAILVTAGEAPEAVVATVHLDMAAVILAIMRLAREAAYLAMGHHLQAMVTRMEEDCLLLLAMMVPLAMVTHMEEERLLLLLAMTLPLAMVLHHLVMGLPLAMMLLHLVMGEPMVAMGKEKDMVMARVPHPAMDIRHLATIHTQGIRPAMDIRHLATISTQGIHHLATIPMQGVALRAIHHLLIQVIHHMGIQAIHHLVIHHLVIHHLVIHHLQATDRTHLLPMAIPMVRHLATTHACRGATRYHLRAKTMAHQCVLKGTPGSAGARQDPRQKPRKSDQEAPARRRYIRRLLLKSQQHLC